MGTHLALSLTFWNLPQAHQLLAEGQALCASGAGGENVDGYHPHRTREGKEALQ